MSYCADSYPMTAAVNGFNPALQIAALHGTPLSTVEGESGHTAPTRPNTWKRGDLILVDNKTPGTVVGVWANMYVLCVICHLLRTCLMLYVLWWNRCLVQFVRSTDWQNQWLGAKRLSARK
jgi:hypothetical protein